MSIDSRPKLFSLSININDLVDATPFPEGYVGLFINNGSPMPPEEVLAHLTIEKARGRTVIPASGECGNPCPHAARGCTGFDHGGKGCPGRYTD